MFIFHVNKTSLKANSIAFLDKDFNKSAMYRSLQKFLVDIMAILEKHLDIC